MSEPAFNEGDEVVVTDGDWKGQYGVVKRYDDMFERYMVNLPDVMAPEHFAACTEGELALLSEDDEEVVDEIPVYDFPISQETFQEHLEYLMARSLEHVGNVGAEQAFFGFEQWEGKSASEVLVGLMTKLEEGMALFTQAHILIGRVVIALESVHDQVQ